ncbi:MAG: carboxypeptidase-like regulatory domain-containing protein [Verrucomicrobiaceae bacterium]
MILSGVVFSLFPLLFEKVYLNELHGDDAGGREGREGGASSLEDVVRNRAEEDDNADGGRDFTMEEVEAEIGGGFRFTQDEIEAKPDDAPWSQWLYSVLHHRSKVSRNGSIEFYGKVVDTEGRPLPGASVKTEIPAFRVSIAEVMRAGNRWDTTKANNTTTDESGRFQIHEEVGASIDLRDIVIEGYETVWKVPPVFNFNPTNPEELHHPDAENPVEFVMRRVGE